MMFSCIIVALMITNPLDLIVTRLIS